MSAPAEDPSETRREPLTHALREPPRRVAQLQAPARRHLKVKLAAY